jgi:D-sedoheptulose 7-phosphate isomerase
MSGDGSVEPAVREHMAVAAQLLEPAQRDAIECAAALVADSLRSGGKVLLFGNGGSAADAIHLAGEFVGRFMRERRSLPAVALTANPANVTAIANDYGFERVFARQIEGLGGPDDIAIAISTSGNSPNVLAGIEAARLAGMRTVALTGAGGAALREAVDVCIAVPSGSTPRIQEAHGLVGHIICDLVEGAVTAPSRSLG